MYLAALALMLVGAAPALHAQADDEGEGAKWNWFGSLRIRPEYNDNLSDLDLGRDDKIGYASYRVNLGTEVSLDRNISVVLDVQGVGASGDDFAVVRGTQTFNQSSSYFSLYRGYIDVKDLFGEKIDLRVGRQELVFGDEFLLGDNNFYGGASWDAVRGDFKHTVGTMTAFWAKVGELDHPEFYGNQFYSDPGGDWEFYGLYEAMKFGESHNVDLAVLYNFDHAPTSYYGGPAFSEKRFTYHARYAFEPETGFFGSVNAAIQNGRTLDPTGSFNVDADSHGLEGTAGFRWMKDGRKAQVHVKIANYSGDDPSTDQNETFNPLAQDFHNRYGMLDFWNGIWGRQAYVGGAAGFRALQLGFETELANGITLAAVAQRNFRTIEPSALATNRNMGQEFGVLATYAYGKNLDLNFCYAQLFAGTANSNEAPYFTKSTGRRLYVGATARF
jgi:hypothetical protein